MIPINNSDTAWLIVSDYLQDNNLPYEDLKKDITSPDINQWIFTYSNLQQNYVGTENIIGGNYVGYPNDDFYRFGYASLGGNVGWTLNELGNFVGGNDDTHQQ